jgi:hypothetical protein
MSGFVSAGSSFGAGVVARASRGGWVWACRSLRAGLRPAPAAYCVPFSCRASALAFAASVSRSLGWRAVARPARRCASACEVKVLLPAGLPAARARAMLELVSA